MNALARLVLALLLIAGGHSYSQSQMAMNDEAAQDLKKADAELNRVYKKVLSQNSEDSRFCADLKEAQRAWVKFVEYHLKTVFPLKDGEDPRVVYGSIYPLDFAVAKTKLIEARTSQLKELLQE